jgi:phosphoribosyl-ATP pyrophosphohydrolase/phosphoribosyl-AMP cyclohydrolase
MTDLDSRVDREIRTQDDLKAVRFDPAGLIPVVSQDAQTGEVLMVAWANRLALEETLATRIMHFWSRSRTSLWKKGETSGNTQSLVSLHLDCDGDTLLALVHPVGPACHTGESTCFGEGSAPEPAPSDGGARPSILGELSLVLEDRDKERPEGSYTTRLLEDENLRLKKLGEEMTELVIELVRGEGRAPEEAADLLYHLLVALRGAGHGWREVEEILARRRR